MTEEEKPLPVEIVLSEAGGISALGSAKAPFLFFDSAPFHGLSHGTAMLTLVAERQVGMLGADGVGSDLVVVAHLRCALPALRALKAAVDGLLAMGRIEVAPPRPTLATAVSLASVGSTDPARAPVVERFPSLQGAISALASADAPFVHFDSTPFYGTASGTGRVTLVAQRQIATMPEGTVGSDLVIVGHLRGPFQAFLTLRTAIEGILFMAAPGGRPH